MKKEFKLNRLFVFMLVLGCSFSFVACSDDDDPVWEVPGAVTPVVMFGDYTGKMQALTVSPTEREGAEGEETPTGADISAKVDNDTVYFENFPIKDIVFSIIDDEETANKILEAVGNVNYKIGYSSTLTEAKDSVKFVLDPKPLKLALSIPAEGEETETLNIEVKVSPAEGGNYELKTTKLKFRFHAEKVLLGEGEGQIEFPDFTPTTFDFAMEKTEK